MDSYEAGVNYLARSQRTVEELKRYLLKKKFSDEEISKTVNELLKLGYLDDNKYIKNYLEYALCKYYGAYKIYQELKKKGIREYDYEDALMQYEEDIGCSLSDICNKKANEFAEKFMLGKETDEKQIAKLGRRLKSLGHSSDVIYSIIGIYIRR